MNGFERRREQKKESIRQAALELFTAHGTNKVIVGGGGAGSIGQATVRILKAEGAIPIVADKQQVDLGDSEQVQDFFGGLSKLHPAIQGYVSLVWHADEEGNLLSITPKGLEAQMHNTFYAAVYPCKTAVDWIIKTGGGSIVVLSSINALVGLGQTAYAMAKSALHSLVRDAAIDFAQYKIRINALLPGTVQDTPCWQKEFQGDPALTKKISAAYPDGQLTTANEVAQTIAFLLSKASSMFNGAILIGDRGWSLSPSIKARKGSWYKQ